MNPRTNRIEHANLFNQFKIRKAVDSSAPRRLTPAGQSFGLPQTPASFTLPAGLSIPLTPPVPVFDPAPLWVRGVLYNTRVMTGGVASNTFQGNDGVHTDDGSLTFSDADNDGICKKDVRHYVG